MILLNLLINGVIFISKKAIISKTLIATLGAAGALAMANTASADTNVQVQSGDTVWNFAQEYQTTVDSIAQRNQLANPNLIYVGQNLIIPDSAASAVTTGNTTAAASTSTAASTEVSTAAATSSDTANTTGTTDTTTAEYSAAAANNATAVTSEAADVATGSDTASQPASTADQAVTGATASATSASVASGATITLNSTANTTANTTTAASTSAAPTTVSYEANSAAANQAMANYTIQYGSVDSSANSAQTVYQNAAAVNSSSQATTQAAAGGSTQSTSAAVATARSMIGVPYVWGGNTPSGFDCSGLVQYAYNLGSNYRTTYQQTNLGQHKYDVENAQSGDLYFWGTESAPYHVAIAEGNGNYIQAPTPGQNVQEGNIQYYRPNFYISMNQ